MPISFESRAKRIYWTQMGLTLAVNYVILLIICLAVGSGEAAFIWAVVALIALELLVGVYGAVGFAKRLGWYFWVDKEQKIDAFADEFVRHSFPTPDRHYNDADEYLKEAALSHEVTDDGHLTAGFLLGVLTARRDGGPRSEALANSMAIEEALRRVAKRGYKAPAVAPTNQSNPDFDFQFDIDPPARN